MMFVAKKSVLAKGLPWGGIELRRRIGNEKHDNKNILKPIHLMIREKSLLLY